MTRTQELKRPIRAFMQAHYTDERLAMLLAHAQSGKLAYNSCCCFLGCANAPHALLGDAERSDADPLHHWKYKYPGSLGSAAEDAFCDIGKTATDEERRRILIPMIRAEMKRREKVREQNQPTHNAPLLQTAL